MPKSISTLFETNPNYVSSNWLIVGKGPTFSLYLDLINKEYLVLGINNVCTKKSVDLTLIIDYHNINQAGNSLLANSTNVVVPWYMHENNKPSKKDLIYFINNNKILKTLDKSDRLWSFNSSLSDKQKPGIGPRIYGRYFSGVFCVSLLCKMGVRKIRTCGIDNGFAYHSSFDKKNLGLNGRNSFDIQMKEISNLTKKHNVDFAKLK